MNPPPPLKVFILAGQSNMVGHGSIQHLDLLVRSAQTKKRCRGSSSGSGAGSSGGFATSASLCCNEYRKKLFWNSTTIINQNNNKKRVVVRYKTKENVYIQFDQAHGQLTVSRQSGYAATASFGPELMFGWTVGDAFQTLNNNTTVLLIKTAWGGVDLAIDFRPPSSGVGNYSDRQPEEYGLYYRMMMEAVNNTLANLTNYVPTYNDSTGYELSGFIWFQGWNDFLDWPKVDEYGYNLANLIRDVRRDLKVDQLPVVIGELGMHGTVLNPKDQETAKMVMAMRAQQLEVTQLAEFRKNSLFVRTAPFVVPKGTAYNGDYHYYGRADTIFYIGQAMGRGVLQLLNISAASVVDKDPCEKQPWPQWNTTEQYFCDASTYCSFASSNDVYCSAYP